MVNLEDQGIKTPCIIVKSDESSIYATRDLAAILYRARTYNYDKSLYVVACEQDLHFKQLFAVAKYLDLDEKSTIEAVEEIKSKSRYFVKETPIAKDAHIMALYTCDYSIDKDRGRLVVFYIEE